MYDYNLEVAYDSVNDAVDKLGEIAEKHHENANLFDAITEVQMDLKTTLSSIKTGDDSFDELNDDFEALQKKMDDMPDEDTILSDYDTHNTGFGDVHIKCENENDHQLFMALLDCLKQPNVNRNHLLAYLHQRARLMAGFCS